MRQASDDPQTHDDIRDRCGARLQATDDVLAGAFCAPETAARFKVSPERTFVGLFDFGPTPSAPPVANGAAYR